MKKTKYNSALPLMLFFFLGIMMSIPCEAQNTIYKHPACNSETSLIRYYKKNVDIRVELWVIDPWGNYSQSCSYVDRATGNAYTFYFPSYCVISDFEILNGNVYFCGNDLPGAYWGYFNIDSVFFLGGDIYYVPVPTTSSTHINHLRFLEVFKESGLVHIVMTGAGNTGTGTGNVIAEAWQTTSGWKFQYTIDPESALIYRDITLTDNYIVIVGTYYGEHMVLHYDKPSGTNAYLSMFQLLPPPISIPLHITSGSIFIPYNIYTGMYVQHTSGDGFATVCNNSATSYVVSYYTNPLTNPYERFSFSDNTSGILEISYNGYSNSLCITKGWYTIYRMMSPVASVESINTNMHHWTSIDDIPKSNHFILSGSSWDLSTAMHWLYDVNNPNDCITIGNIPIQDLQRNQYNINLTQYPNDLIITWRDYPVRIIPSNIFIECN